MTSFVQSLGIRVITCFDAKTRLSDTRAFRVCINKEDTETFLNTKNWPKDIIIREWSFKGKNLPKNNRAQGSSDCDPEEMASENPTEKRIAVEVITNAIIPANQNLSHNETV